MKYKARDFFEDWEKRILKDEVAEIFAGNVLEVRFKDGTIIKAVQVGEEEGETIYSDETVDILAAILRELREIRSILGG